MQEIWKTVKGHEGYEISNYGRLRAKKRQVTYKDGRVATFSERILKPMLTKKGYYKYHLSSNQKKGYRTSKLAHRLVAEHFIPNPDNKPQVNHIDGKKTNNYYKNLEWVTNEENHQHKLDHNLYPTTHMPKCVQAVSIENGQIIKTFPSLYQAGKWVRPNQSPSKAGAKISEVARGKRKTAYGYIWQYVNKV